MKLARLVLAIAVAWMAIALLAALVFSAAYVPIRLIVGLM